DDAEAGADAEDRRQQADAARDLLARKLVADDPEREREDSARDALDDPAGDDEGERVRERVDDRSRTEDDERPHEHALLAVHVAQTAEDGGADRRREEVAGQEPGDAVLARM